VKVKVDPTKCEGFGPCNETLPAVFLLDEWGYAYTEAEGEIPGGKEDAARQAVAGCPVHAITIVDEA
jgi:ferredoxin